MISVGWLADDPGYIGGAELTQQEFRDAAPDDVEIIDCPPGGVVRDLDRYVVNNCARYLESDLEPMGDAPIIRYVNDVWPFGDPDLRWDLLINARLIFTSPLHRERFPHEIRSKQVYEIPPALNLDHFRVANNGHLRQGNVCVGRMAYGKGLDLLLDYGEPVDVYSTVPVPSGGNLTYKGSVAAQEVPRVLSAYQRFIFLPTALEPFGRAVVEAWVAGCELVINRNVGARYWIEENPKGLETAAGDFWGVVTA